jgi:Cu2+-exporting ATPase
MNTLVALGAVSALGVSTAAAAIPSIGWATFFEEPAMLLGVVLLGRALEEWAKLQVVFIFCLWQGCLLLLISFASSSQSVCPCWL